MRQRWISARAARRGRTSGDRARGSASSTASFRLGHWWRGSAANTPTPSGGCRHCDDEAIAARPEARLTSRSINWREAMSDEALFDKGLPIRREVLGTEYVDGSLARADDFMMPLQRVATAWGWGAA